MNYSSVLFWELINVMYVMDLLRKSLTLPSRSAQVNPIAIQVTPGPAHLHPRLIGNVVAKV
jgi:hypothetical protein